MKKLVLFILLLPLFLFAQNERPGSTDGQFLKIGVSPRAAAMGESFISAVDNAEATFYNPAALARIPGTSLVFNHTQWFADIKHEFAAASRSFGTLGTFALSVTALYTDEMQVTTPLQPGGTGETFYAGNYRFGLSYARYLTDRVTLGGTINYIHMSLYESFDANAVGGDIAILYVTGFRNFRFGMKIANFGSEVKYVNESYPLPTTFQFGLSMNALQMEQQKLLISFSAAKPNDGKPLSQIGAEWSYDDLVFLRGGYHINHDVAQYAFGGGLQWGMSGFTLKFDYAYSDFSLLGVTHRFGAGFTF
ncbi:MAG: PorV/PorQ family protein [Calditrichia bacterium]